MKQNNQKKSIFYMEKDIPIEKLLTKEKVLTMAKADPYTVVAKIKEYEVDTFNMELTWYYPISDDIHLGFYIIPVQEGFLSLPLEYLTDSDEQVNSHDIKIFDLESIGIYINEFQAYADGLLNVMQDIKKVLSNTETDKNTEGIK